MICDKCLKDSNNIYHVSSFREDKSFCEDCIKPLFNCKDCGPTEFHQSDIEGYKHLCDCCSSWKMKCELEEQWDKELKIYTERVGEEYDDINAFCLDCDGENPIVLKYNLNGLPELIGFYEMVRGHYEEVYGDLDSKEGQLSIKF